MDWEKPEFVEISLACEVSGYANAQLNEEQRRTSCNRDRSTNEDQTS